MKFSRIALGQTNYSILDNWQYLTVPPVDQLNQIYRCYCEYKKFVSVMPIFDSQYQDSNTDVMGYYHNEQLIAFSLIKRYDTQNAECVQFAWNYADPELRLGINSLKNECAVYRARGFRYLYLGLNDLYKQQIDGFEVVGPLTTNTNSAIL